MTHVTCRLTAKNRDQLRNPTLGNRVWATYTVLMSAQQLHGDKGGRDDITPVRRSPLFCLVSLRAKRDIDFLREVAADFCLPYQYDDGALAQAA